MAAACGSSDGPRTPVQAGLTYLWSGLLKLDHVSLDDDFFALGGNSLLAAEMLAHARVMFGISADYVRPLTRCLLRDPTLRGSPRPRRTPARAGSPPTATRPRVDFAREAELRSTGAPLAADAARTGGPDWRRPLEILLTGSTGFLGAHLLRELLAATTARVWCLVRARDAAHARRASRMPPPATNSPPCPADRVVPLPGDLASPRLGLSAANSASSARSIDIIYHAGAAGELHLPVRGAAGRQRDGHP